MSFGQKNLRKSEDFRPWNSCISFNGPPKYPIKRFNSRPCSGKPMVKKPSKKLICLLGVVLMGDMMIGGFLFCHYVTSHQNSWVLKPFMSFKENPSNQKTCTEMIGKNPPLHSLKCRFCRASWLPVFKGDNKIPVLTIACHGHFSITTLKVLHLERWFR